MRIAFLWKWWSWKTTLSWNFANYLNAKNKKVLLVDADINMHLNTLVWIDRKNIKPLSDNWKLIENYINKNRSDVENIPFIGSMPPTLKSNFIKWIDDEFLNQISCTNDKWLKFMAIWNYNDSDVWVNCYHWKTDNYIKFLNHFLDKNDDIMIADSVTWIDNIWNPLIYSYDLNVIVVEPNQKSLWIYKDFIKGLENLWIDLNLKVVWNKVMDDEDILFLKKNIKSEHFLCYLKKSKNMKNFDRWDEEWLWLFMKEHEDIFDKIYNHLISVKKDYEKYYKNILDNHKFVSNSYYNDYYNIDFNKFIDPDFNFNKVL